MNPAPSSKGKKPEAEGDMNSAPSPRTGSRRPEAAVPPPRPSSALREAEGSLPRPPGQEAGSRRRHEPCSAGACDCSSVHSLWKEPTALKSGRACGRFSAAPRTGFNAEVFIVLHHRLCCFGGGAPSPGRAAGGVCRRSRDAFLFFCPRKRALYCLRVRVRGAAAALWEGVA